MTGPHIQINAKSYLLASEGSLPKGAVQWNAFLEPSQRGDPSQLRKVSWRVDGPMGNSFEGPEGFLGVDYCLPGDTSVRMFTQVRAVMRRPYAGELVEVTTASGKQLAGTPNHPVLTTEGWVPLGRLNERHRLFCDGLDERTSGAAPDGKYVEASIQQVFDLARESLVSPRHGDASHDFDADGLHKEIDVVPVDGLLWDRIKARLSQPDSKLTLTPANVGVTSGHRDGVPLPLGVTRTTAGSSCVNASQAFGPHLWRKRLPCFGGTRAALFGGKCHGTLTSAITQPRSHLRVRGKSSDARIAETAHVNPSTAERCLNGRGVNVVIPSDAPGSLPGGVTVEDVVSLRRYPFRGHVFNLSTDDHWYGAKGIITHNCDNVDTRWDGMTTGPLINSVTLSTYDASSYTVTLRPTLNFGTMGFTPSAGTNAECVDEAVANDDVDYNAASATASDRFRFAVTGLPVGTAITSITLNARIRKTGTGTPASDFTFGFASQAGGPASVASIALTNDTSYHDYSQTYTVGPSGGPWSVEELDALLCGYDFGSGDPIRVTQFWVTVTGTVPNACGSAVAVGPNNEYFLYVIRGKDVAKVDMRSMTLVNPGTVITLGDDAASIVTTETPSGTQEVAIGIEGTTAYRVITTVAAAGTADTHAAATGNPVRRIIGQAPDRVASFDTKNVYMNVLSASVTMAAPNWQSMGIMSRRGITPTGFASRGKLWVIGTNDGPYVLNPDTGIFDALVPALGLSLENCRATWLWPPAGVLCGTVNGLRYVNDYASATIGPENLSRNTSPVQGWVTAGCDSARWVFASLYNFRTNDTYLLAGRARLPEDPPGTGEVAWFPIATFEEKRSDFLRNADREGGSPYSILIGGYGANLFYLTQGRTEDWRDDTSVYRYATSGTWYGTELRRDMGMVKDLEAVEFTLAGSIGYLSMNSCTLAWSVDGAAYQSLTAIAGTDGLGAYRQLFVSGGVPLNWATGKRIKPKVTLSTSQSGTTGASFKLIGNIDLHYRERPVMMEVLRFTLQLDGSLHNHGMAEQQDDLQALVDGSGPVLIEKDRDDNAGYWNVTDVTFETKATPGPQGTDIRYAYVTAKRWPQTSGD